MPITLESALGLYSIPVVWMTAFYPMMMKGNLIDRVMGYNRAQPRLNSQQLANDPTVSPEMVNRIARLEGAHLNGNEILPLWIAAIIVGNQAKLTNKIINTISIAFIATRILYNYIYTNNKTEAQSRMRTVVWLGSLAMPMTLIISAANKVRQLGGLPVL